LASALVTRRYIGAKGVELAADVAGDPRAPTIILLHGGGQTRHSWGGAMRQLVLRGYHVINLDARGHGDSQWAADGDYTLDVLAQDLECVIATLKSRPALVGASMGGATALLVAGAHPDPVAAVLVLVDVVPRIDTDGAAKIRSFMSSGAKGFGTLQEASDAVAAYNPHRPRPKSNAGLMKNLRLRIDGRLYWHWDPRVLQQVRHAEPPLFADRLNTAAEQVRIPTLLVRGLESDIVAEAAVTDFRAHLPQLQVFDVSGAGHMVAGDKNDAFNQGVFEFMQRHLPPDAPAP
jgi:pimeloyl-ACP methyl ester carboxylesterase